MVYSKPHLENIAIKHWTTKQYKVDNCLPDSNNRKYYWRKTEIKSFSSNIIFIQLLIHLPQ